MRTGGLIIHLKLNGASSKSICGGNQRQSRMSFVFWQICCDFRLATFSTESANNGHRRIELGSADLEPQGFCTRRKFGVDSEIFSSSDVISTGTSAKSGVLR